MASRLDCIGNWDVLASQAHFRVSLLAEVCGVTERQLRRYFQLRFGSSPHAWMMAKRLEQVQSHLAEGWLVKEVAFEAGFKHQSNFTRQFKRQFHTPPVSLRRH